MSELIYPSAHMARADILGYGMPHIGCRYTRDDVAATAFDDDWVPCAVCGATATNRHHLPPRGKHSAIDPETGRKRPGALLLMTTWGRFVLKPALIALCGSGTTGCHHLWHAREVEIAWAFDSPEYEGRWLDGYLLAHGMAPHSEELYGIGCWHFHDKRNGNRWEYRGGGY